MADNDNVRQRIVSSVFNRRNAAGQQETYVGHLKIWEDAEDGMKPRYIILSRMSLCVSTLGGLFEHLACFRRQQRSRFHPQVKVEYQWVVFGWENMESFRVARDRSGQCMCYICHIYACSNDANVQTLNLNVTLSRTYRWRTEQQTDLLQFVQVLIRTSRTVTGGAPLRLVGIPEPDVGGE